MEESMLQTKDLLQSIDKPHKGNLFQKKEHPAFT